MKSESGFSLAMASQPFGLKEADVIELVAIDSSGQDVKSGQLVLPVFDRLLCCFESVELSATPLIQF